MKLHAIQFLSTALISCLATISTAHADEEEVNLEDRVVNMEDRVKVADDDSWAYAPSYSYRPDPKAIIHTATSLP